MDDFKDLNPPQEALLGWYVLCTYEANEYLHDDGQTHIGCEDSFYQSSGYFDTEMEAHLAAERYYLKRCRKYPHTFTKVGEHKTVTSQVMNFYA